MPVTRPVRAQMRSARLRAGASLSCARYLITTGSPQRSADGDARAPSQVTVAGDTPKYSGPLPLSTVMASSRTSWITPVATDVAAASRGAPNSWSRGSKTAARKRARLANQAGVPDSGGLSRIARTTDFRRTCPQWDCSRHHAMSDDSHIQEDASSDSPTSACYDLVICR
jgi:hypothetical protein